MNFDQIHIFQVVKSTGGVGQYSRWLAKGLDRERYRLTYACLSDGGAELAQELNQIDGVRAFSLGMARYHVDPIGDALLAVKLAQIIRRERFDLIHAHASKPGFLVRVAALGTGIPVIYRPACFSFHDAVPRTKARVLAAIERVAARYLTAYIQCVCNDERELANRYRVGSKQQLITIHTGIDPKPYDIPVDRDQLCTQLGIPSDAIVIGSVGRLSGQKAPLDYIHAASIVHQQQPDIHFVWVGSGELESEARAAVSQSNLNSVFHFLGERRDIPQLLQLLNIFVLSSHWEGFSLSVLEAMAAKLPVIATRVMGTAEAVADGENGFLVPMASPQLLGQAMLRLVSDPNRMLLFGQVSRQRIEQFFTRERMMAQIATLYEQAVA